MKQMKKLFILFSMLIAGLSFKSANSVNKMVVADAAEPGSYAYLNNSWRSHITSALSEQGMNDIALLKNLLITNHNDRLPKDRIPLSGCPVEVGLTDTNYAPTNYTNGCAVAAYVYSNTTDTTKYDCIFYADVETIYPSNGANIFSGLENVEKITFDCNFSMANATDKSMSYMFSQCSNLTTIEGLENFNTSNVINMSTMFSWNYKLTTVDVSSFDTSNVTNMEFMFSSCENLTTIKGLENFNTVNVTNMNGMFLSCWKLPSLDVSSFDTSKVTDMDGMFESCGNLTTIKGLENFRTPNVININNMFNNCSSLKELDVSGFDTSKVTDMEYMFGWCQSLTTIKGLENFNTSNVTNMQLMFAFCSNLTALDVSHFDTSNVTNMSSMFSNCSSLKELDVSSFDTSKVTNMYGMFESCGNLTTIKGLESFNTSKVTDMNLMFYDCASLTTLDLSSFDLSSIEDGSKLNNFLGFLSNLEEIKAPKNLNNYTIHLYFDFGMSEIDSSMEGMTLLKGSKEFNILYNTLLKINVCTEYTQAPELQAMYDGLSNEEKDKLATLSDDGGVILTDKLSYMVSYADYKANEATTTAETHLVISPRTSQYLVIVIACLSLALIGGYYFIQKKKYAK